MKTPTLRAATPIHAGRRADGTLIGVLLLALALRALLWGQVPRTGLISDEGEYLSAATWLADGRGFSWYQAYLWTRAPVYPLFVAAHLRLFGDTRAPLYITQTILSLLNVALVYLLAKRLTPELRMANGRLSAAGRSIELSHGACPRAQTLVPLLAGLLMAVYLPFALYAQVLLSETLFITLLLAGFLALGRWAGGRPMPGDVPGPGALVERHGWLVVAGVLFGVATLTRSLTLAFLPIAALWALVARRGNDGGHAGCGRSSFVVRPLASIIFLISAGLIILPWTIYTSLRLYGGLVVVDTTGAFNLMVGARTAYDGRRDDAPPREFVLALLDKNLSEARRRAMLAAKRAPDGTLLRDPACLVQRDDPRLRDALRRTVTDISQAERQRLMTAEGLCLIFARPGAFIQKSLAELIDLFRINYGGDERFADGFTLGRLPRPYLLGLFLLDDTIYVLTLPLAAIGWGLARRMKDEEPRTKNQGRGTNDAAGTRSLVIRHSSLVGLIGLWWLYNIAVAPLLFAINRFRLPLLPFAFIFAAYAIVALKRGGWRGMPRGYGALALLLLLIVATPYAYLEPRAAGADSSWASYLGPYPSSLASTVRAWRARPGYLAEGRLKAALGRGDAATASALIAGSQVTSRTLSIARPLLAGLEGRPAEGLAMLPPQAIARTTDVELAVVRGDLLRRKGDLAGARALLGQMFVDSANPVQLAWDWLHPAPLPGNRIDLAGNLDLGYIEGCYLGEGDTSLTPPANFRWCADGARLRFPAAGTGAPQTLTLRVDGRGWASYAQAAPPARVFLGALAAGVLTPDIAGVTERSVVLPATPRGADVVVTLHTPTFVPSAERYLSQQGKAVVGQVQRLGLRIDWAELRETAP